MKTKPYQIPLIEVVDVEIEGGIASSLTGVDDYQVYEGWETL